VVRVLQLVATPKASRRGLRKRTAEEPQGDGVLWPLLREQQLLRAHLPEADQAAAAARAQLLVSQGYGVLQGWLEAPEAHPGERPPQPTQGTACDSAAKNEIAVRRKSADLADLFDAA
jgi:hypothetical protein